MTITAELLPGLPAPPPDRRRSGRHKPAQSIGTMIGRGKGVLVDVSLTGARIRHTWAVARGAQVRVRFDWTGERFEAVGEVLASRVVGIGPEGTQFESRLRFLPLTEASAAMLERALSELGDDDLRKWVANLRGWTEEDANPHRDETPPPARTFIRCRFVSRRWDQRVTRDPSTPPDGFTVAGGTEPSEIRALCRTFEQTDAEGRRLLQLMTSAVLAQSAG
jgi:hypothetical protein